MPQIWLDEPTEIFAICRSPAAISRSPLPLQRVLTGVDGPNGAVGRHAGHQKWCRSGHK
jgi:hypothetical protein